MPNTYQQLRPRPCRLHTTTTALFALTKYSRGATHSQLAAENEWQHFTNPIMKLLLDVKKSPSSGELLSLRLRIFWCIDMQAIDMQVDQREVVFEDLELLSFSSLSAIRTQNGSEQGLPLRAVYRDAVVGIRYLHPKTVYRRFQVTFGSILEASQFIDTIKPICPCKPNTQPNQITRNSTMLAGVRMSPTRTGWRSSGISSATLSSEDTGFGISSKAHYLPDSQRKELGALSSSNPSLASSSQPYSSNHNSNMVPPLFVLRNLPRSTEMPVPSPATTDGQDLFPSLGTHPSLYGLSQPDLEHLISQVVREEGFVRLLDGLDALWRTKGFLAR
ncbi:hypothetical protein BKA83DRAFT_674614 [Pisolithus microcarpus]|nr:hypothetical protein BKA83DRAFT_674614 [Pisolithus microcarpus]